MELTVAKKDLLKIVARMQSVSERKATMPVLANVLLTAEEPKSLRLAATDLNMGLVGRVSADITSGGSVAVPVKDFLERIKMMPDGPVMISTQANGTTTLKAKGSARRYNLRGLPGEDFPPLPQPAEGAPSLSLEVDALAKLIQRTHFSISPDETRPHLSSALFEWDGEVVRMVTTDGHRLTKMEITVAGRQASVSMLLPLKAVQELRRQADELLAESPVTTGADGVQRKPELSISQSGSNAFFQSGSTTFSVKLVDAQFPPYAQVIPKTSDKVIRAPRAALADALKAVSIAASERTGGVRVVLADGAMRISSESPESGDGFDEIPIDYQGTQLNIGLNAKYVLDVLGAMNEDEVSLSMSGDLDPVVLQPSDQASHARFLAVVMPMKF